ncbi:hypothetical protein WA026_001923 [Henosepilachna vigintioctopunctata]|uniref:Cyclin N-terminal domain-containing protein n=1 Tax=Henosepilachna vigintioctopunctata TaxID=420089 RepID=A0AAW1UMK3_9CUCU
MAGNNVNDVELLSDWLKDTSEPHEFEEPILDDFVLQTLQFASDKFDLDVHVFILSVCIIEQYLRKRENGSVCPVDEGLILMAGLFISSKFIGGTNHLSSEDAVGFLESVTFRDYEIHMLMRSEEEILRVINFSIPSATVADHLGLLSQMYLERHKINMNLMPLCNQILQMLYVRRKKWYNELKNLYSQDEETIVAFRFLMINKFYIPAAVLLTCWHITEVNTIVDFNTAVNELQLITKIQRDHLNLAAGVILNLFEKKS